MLKSKEENRLIIRESWYFLSALLGLITLIEWWSPGLILIRFNPLFLLVFWLFLAIFLLWSTPSNN